MSLFNDINLNHAISDNFFEPSNRLVDYFPTSKGNNFDYEKYLEFLLSRTNWKDLVLSGVRLHYTAMEKSILGARADLLANNNRAYTIATKLNPTALELEEFSEIKPMWSLLFPIKAYLCDHPETAVDYKGMQPFGAPVIKFFNNVVTKWDLSWEVGTQPNYQDHEHLRTLTNHHAILKGVPTIEINTQMYQEGVADDFDS